jgi:ribonuclease HI
VNCDAALDSKKGYMGFGIVVRDNMGHVLAAKSVMKRGFLEPTATEMMAVFLAMRFSFEKGFHSIILESDAKNVTKAVQSGTHNDCRYGQIVDDILMVLNSISHWQIQHVNRESNTTTHGLAKAAVKQDIDTTCVGEILSCISGIVLAELSACVD